MENQAPRRRRRLKGESPAVQKGGIAAGLLHLGPAALVGRVRLGKAEMSSVPIIVSGDVEGNSVDTTQKMNSFAAIQLQIGGLWMQSGVEQLLSLTVYTFRCASACGCAVGLAMCGCARL